MSLIVLGTVALDTVKTQHGARERILGGSASHFALSARLFTDVHIAGVVGRDFPPEYCELFRRKGINTDSLIKDDGDTFHWEGEYGQDTNVAITKSTRLGVLASFKPAVTAGQKKIKYVFLANVDPEVQAEMIGLMPAPKLIGLDSMNFWINNKKSALLKVMRKVGLFVANDAEAKSLTGESNLIAASKELLKLGPKMAIIKKGEHGVIFRSPTMIFCLPAFPVEMVVDPTGAGDTFAGAFMGYLADKERVSKEVIFNALCYATVMSSFNVEGFAHERTKDLKLNEVERRLRQFRKMFGI